ncbi:hypothetical protein HDU93_004151 [Gonapodya sp. JEL0774]|nr:hypothetical protein HDU93_004151 [Gonapodya sp. JEL0774]
MAPPARRFARSARRATLSPISGVADLRWDRDADLAEENLRLKRLCNSLTKEARVMAGKVRAATEDLERVERKYADLWALSLGPNPSTSTLRSEQTLSVNLKRLLRSRTAELDSLRAAYDAVRDDVRHVRVQQMEQELARCLREIMELKMKSEEEAEKAQKATLREEEGEVMSQWGSRDSAGRNRGTIEARPLARSPSRESHLRTMSRDRPEQRKKERDSDRERLARLESTVRRLVEEKKEMQEHLRFHPRSHTNLTEPASAAPRPTSSKPVTLHHPRVVSSDPRAPTSSSSPKVPPKHGPVHSAPPFHHPSTVRHPHVVHDHREVDSHPPRLAQQTTKGSHPTVSLQHALSHSTLVPHPTTDSETLWMVLSAPYAAYLVAHHSRTAIPGTASIEHLTSIRQAGSTSDKIHWSGPTRSSTRLDHTKDSGARSGSRERMGDVRVASRTDMREEDIQHPTPTLTPVDVEASWYTFTTPVYSSFFNSRTPTPHVALPPLQSAPTAARARLPASPAGSSHLKLSSDRDPSNPLLGPAVGLASPPPTRAARLRSRHAGKSGSSRDIGPKTEDEAARKLQGAWRRWKARKGAAASRGNGNERGKVQSLRVEIPKASRKSMSISGSNGGLVPLERSIDVADLDRFATRVQTAYRGWSVRRMGLEAAASKAVGERKRKPLAEDQWDALTGKVYATFLAGRHPSTQKPIANEIDAGMTAAPTSREMKVNVPGLIHAVSPVPVTSMVAPAVQVTRSESSRIGMKVTNIEEDGGSLSSNTGGLRSLAGKNSSAGSPHAEPMASSASAQRPPSLARMGSLGGGGGLASGAHIKSPLRVAAMVEEGEWEVHGGSDGERQRAAVKVQAAFRGHRVRKAIKAEPGRHGVGKGGGGTDQVSETVELPTGSKMIFGNENGRGEDEVVEEEEWLLSESEGEDEADGTVGSAEGGSRDAGPKEQSHASLVLTQPT